MINLETERRQTVLVCPGFHPAALTEACLRSLHTVELATDQWLVFPAERYPVYSGGHVLRFLHEQTGGRSPQAWLNQSVIFLGFSAGAVGAIAAAWGFHGLGGTVRAVFAVDGWGVPLGGPFPVHRLSHDRFTDWSAALLGSGGDRFYADPPVAHLDLWRSPHTAVGQWLEAQTGYTQPTTAAMFLQTWLSRYQSPSLDGGSAPRIANC